MAPPSLTPILAQSVWETLLDVLVEAGDPLAQQRPRRSAPDRTWIYAGEESRHCLGCGYDWYRRPGRARGDHLHSGPSPRGDPDALAEAHNYRSLPTTPALWALSTSTATFVGLGERLPPETTFLHGDWGEGTVADGTRWLGHEFVHHLLDVDARASASPT